MLCPFTEAKGYSIFSLLSSPAFNSFFVGLQYQPSPSPASPNGVGFFGILSDICSPRSRAVVEYFKATSSEHTANHGRSSNDNSTTKDVQNACYPPGGL